MRGLRHNEAEAAHRLFSGLQVLDIGSQAGWRAGEWRRDYAARGVKLWQADCLVAACTALAAGVLVTGNPKDFPMAESSLVFWPVGN